MLDWLQETFDTSNWSCFTRDNEQLSDSTVKTTSRDTVKTTSRAKPQGETLEEAFEKASEKYHDWMPQRPLSDRERLTMHALEMQARFGDVQGKAPPRWKPHARAKWYAWAQLEGDMKTDIAKRKFIQELEYIIRQHGTRQPKS